MSNDINSSNNSTSYNVLSGWFKEMEKAQGANSTNNALEQETKRMMSYLQNMQSTFQGALGSSGSSTVTGLGDDPYGRSSQERNKGETWTGRSNLSHSPEVLLAINDILKSGGKNVKDTAKILNEKYGIQAEVKDITTVNANGKEVTKKGIAFGNGDFMVDSNGDGFLNSGDYDFANAIKDLKTKNGLTDDNLKNYVDKMKTQGVSAGGLGITGQSMTLNTYNNQDINSMIQLLFLQALMTADNNETKLNDDKTNEKKYEVKTI